MEKLRRWGDHLRGSLTGERGLKLAYLNLQNLKHEAKEGAKCEGQRVMEMYLSSVRKCIS